jgi:hypothetical protein
VVCTRCHRAVASVGVHEHIDGDVCIDICGTNALAQPRDTKPWHAQIGRSDR